MKTQSKKAVNPRNRRAKKSARSVVSEAARIDRLRAVVAAAVARHGAYPVLVTGEDGKEKLPQVEAFFKASEGFASAWQARQFERGHGERAAAIQSDVAAAWRACHAAAFVRAGYTLPAVGALRPRQGMESTAAAIVGAACLRCLRLVGGGVAGDGGEVEGGGWLVRGVLRRMRPAVRGGGTFAAAVRGEDGKQTVASVDTLPLGLWLEWRRAGARASLEARRLLWAGGEEGAVFESIESLRREFGVDDTERVAGAAELRAAAADALAVHLYDVDADKMKRAMPSGVPPGCAIERPDRYLAPRALARRVAWARWCLVAFHVSSGSREWKNTLRADRRRLAVVARIARGEGVAGLERLGVALGEGESASVRDCDSVEKLKKNLLCRIAGGDVLLTERPDAVLSRINHCLGWRAVKAFEAVAFAVDLRGGGGEGAAVLAWAKGEAASRIARESLSALREVKAAAALPAAAGESDDCDSDCGDDFAFTTRGGGMLLSSERGASWRASVAAAARRLVKLAGGTSARPSAAVVAVASPAAGAGRQIMEAAGALPVAFRVSDRSPIAAGEVCYWLPYVAS